MLRAGATLSTPDPQKGGAAWVVGVPVLVAAVLRAVVCIEFANAPIFRAPLIDAAVYDEWARTLARGDAYGAGGVFFLAPLYPYLLAVVYAVARDGPLVAVTLQHLLGTGLVAVCGLAAWRAAGARAAAAASWLLALHAPFMIYENLLLAEVVGAVLLTAAVLLLVTPAPLTRRRAATSGLLFGLDVLVRPSALLMAAAFFPWLLRRGRASRRAALLFLAGCVLVVVPVTLRNRVVGGAWVPVTSSGGYNLYIGNHAGADGTFALPAGVHFVPGDAGDPSGRQAAQQAAGRALTDGEVSAYWLRRTVHEVTAAPLQSASLFARKLLLVWNRAEVPQIIDLGAVRADSRILGLPLVGAGVVMPLALYGLIFAFRGRPLRAPLVLALLAFTVTTAVFFVTARYRIQAVPLLTLAAAGGLTQLLDALGRRGRSSLVAALVFLACVVLTSPHLLGIAGAGERWIPAMNRALRLAAIGADSSAVMAAFRDAASMSPAEPRLLTNRGTYRLAIGDAAGARTDFFGATELAPDDPVAWTGLGDAELALGELERAQSRLRRALSLDPEYTPARVALGQALHRAGRTSEARAELERAVRIDPSAEAEAALGLVLVESGATTAAIEHLRRAASLEPERAVHHYNLGLALREQRDPRARAALERALALDPSHERARLALIGVLVDAGDVEAALEQIDILLTAKPGDPRLRALRQELERMR